MNKNVMLKRIAAIVMTFAMLLGILTTNTTSKAWPWSPSSTKAPVATATPKPSGEWLDVYIYYVYDNQVPKTINQNFNDSSFGPKGDGKSSTKVRVDVAALKKLGYVKGSYNCFGTKDIYSVENKNTNNIVEAAGKHNDTAGLKADSKIRDFWKDLYSCLDDESKKIVDDTYDGQFLGYVLKETATTGYVWHIDGILEVKPEPVATATPAPTATPQPTVEPEAPVETPEPTPVPTATPAPTATPTATPVPEVAPDVYQIEIYDASNGNALAKTKMSNDAETYGNVRDYVEAYLANGAEDFSIDWSSDTKAEYVKDGKVYELTLSQTEPAGKVSSDETTVTYKKMTTTYYLSRFSIESKYVKDVEEEKTVDVELYVLKNELSNVEYGYDVSNNSIIARPESDFDRFGTAKVLEDYLNGLKKYEGSTKVGEILNETLFEYDYETGKFTASGEKTDAKKIIKYIAADSKVAKEYVDKINGEYNIVWYVIKKESTWHIDGYLCKDTTTEENNIKVTVNHKIYDAEKGEYVLLDHDDATVTEEVLANSRYESKSLYAKRDNSGKTITVDGTFTDWETLPEYWVTSEFNKDVTVDTSAEASEAKGLATHSLVKLYNDNKDQKIYAYMKVSDLYDTFFRTDEFSVSVNKGKSVFEFKVGDAEGNIINGDISSMEPGVHRLYIYDKAGNRVVGGEATMLINSNHLNTAIEFAIPYDVVSADITESRLFVTGFEKESGGIIDGLSSTSYDEDNFLNADTQLAYEDTVLCYIYASEQVVESIRFGTISIEGTSTAPYILAAICAFIACAGAGLFGNRFRRRKMNVC